MLANPTHAALYVRISQDRAGEGLGVQRQEAECRAWAKRMGWSVAEVYIDNDLTASKKNVKRPEWSRMMADVAAGRRDGISAGTTIVSSDSCVTWSNLSTLPRRPAH